MGLSTTHFIHTENRQRLRVYDLKLSGVQDAFVLEKIFFFLAVLEDSKQN